MDRPADDVMALCGILRQGIGIMVATTRDFVERSLNSNNEDGGVDGDNDGDQD